LIYHDTPRVIGLLFEVTDLKKQLL